MQLSTDILKEILVSPGHITPEQFSSAQEQVSLRHVPLTQVLIERGDISDLNVGQAIANYFDYHFVDLSAVQIEDSFLHYIPEGVARHQRAIVFGETPEVLKLATENVSNYAFIKLLEKKAQKEVDVYYTTSASLEDAFRYYKEDLHTLIAALTEGTDFTQKNEVAVNVVNAFLEYAYESRASDIHIEPLEREVLVRFRIDGILHEVVTYPRELHPKVVARIKILARLKTDEHAATQDGRFEYKYADSIFDLRVSIMPVTDGENIVMRLLESGSQRFTVEELGLREPDLNKIIAASKKPHGMILSVGPTGSGKTTTLYSILELLNKPEVNIMTIEDPVEYDIDRVQQTQVSPEKDLTFATGLRSIVRQDPDIIMVGEIRDEETADIAVNAAMTGHLLLSTLHTNDAATTFPRLIEMGIEPFLTASSVNVIISQRLVRKICGHCRESYTPTKEDSLIISMSSQISAHMKTITGSDDLSELRLYRGVGCKQCGHTGYRGRIGIFEVLEVTEEIRFLITGKESADVIDRKAREKGMTSVLFDGIEKILGGTTTLEEVIKVTMV